MAVALVGVALIGLFVYMRGQQDVASSRMWLDLEVASTQEDLEKVMTDYPNTVPAQLAEFHLARIKLGPEGIDRLVTGDQAERHRVVLAEHPRVEARAGRTQERGREPAAPDPRCEADDLLRIRRRSDPAHG